MTSWKRTALLASLAAFAAGPGMARQDEAPAATRVAAQDAEQALQDLLDEYEDAMTAYQEAAETAETREERVKVREASYPKPNVWVPRFMAMAERHPRTEPAAKALAWVVTRTRNDQQKKALETLLADHLQSEVLADVCLRLPNDAEGESILERLEQESPHLRVRGMACYALSNRIRPPRRGDDWPHEEQYTALMLRLIERYADVEFRGRKLSAIAEGALFAIERLQIGMPVPDIVGEDIDGVPFNLSDYKGKVLMIDFWGHW